MILASRSFASLFILFVLCLMAFSASPVQAVDTSLVRVYGSVMENGGGPIPDAQIIFWNIQGSFTAKTNASGRYETNVAGQRFYKIYAYGDYPSTPGFDYVPACQQVSVGETGVNISFTLYPGVSINTEGYVPSIETLSLPTAITFTVMDQYGLLGEKETLTKYGWGLLSNHILGLSDGIVVVPSNIPVQVQVDIYYPGKIERRFIIDPPENMSQGDLLSVNLWEYTLSIDVDTVWNHLTSARALAGEAEEVGFYVAYERNRLSRAKDLMNDAGSALAQGFLDEAFADLREAYLILRSVEDGIVSLYVNASQSAIFITSFLGFTSMVIAAVFIDKKRRRLAVSLAFYCTLFVLLYMLFPGYPILQRSAFNPWANTTWEALFTLLLAAASFLGVFLVIYWIPYAFKEKTLTEGLRPVSALAAVHSIATRNLRRRRLRTLLTAAFMFISVFAFIVLTSFAIEHGFFISPHSGARGKAPSEGFILRWPSTTPPMHCMPIPPTMLQEIKRWLGERPEVTLVAVKLENVPRLSRLGSLTSASGEYFIWGILGVYPSLEVQLTEMNQIVEQGRFLHDEDLNGILISKEAANNLQIEVNDTLTFLGKNFTVTGIFDSGKLDALKDLNGESLIPHLQVPGDPGGPPVAVPCASKDVVIIHGETAGRLPGMMVSRVAVQTRSPNEIMILGRQMVLMWPSLAAYAAVASEILSLSVGNYYMASGFSSAVFPLILVVLNVGSLMLGAVYERKREVATMSSLGMNPFHISAVFVAEALVIGVVAGSLGYVVGLTSYRFMAIFMPFEVKQKVEALWGILVLLLSITAAVLGSALPATKASVIVTPSLLKRWRIEERPKTAREPWLLTLPLRIQRTEPEAFFAFMENRLQHPASPTGRLKVSGRGAATRLSFTYTNPSEKIATDNELFLVKGRFPNRYTIRLATMTTGPRYEANLRETANFIRRLILQYSIQQRPRG